MKCRAPLVCLLTASMASLTWSEPPGDASSRLELPAGVVPGPEQLLPSDPESKARSQAAIRAALNGESVRGESPILSDVLDVVKSRGSVLNGSSLDADSRFNRLPGGGQPPSGGPSRREARPAIGFRSSIQTDMPDRSRFLIAESLLRSARQLETISPSDPLVNQLRQRAVSLLSAESHRVFNPSHPPVLTAPNR
ncbi:MAG: hypothetical protein AAF539_10920 [Planctomycetota bacterium]